MKNRPIKVLDLATEEVYNSLEEAGRKLGYLTSLKVPEWAMDGDEEFVRRGRRLKIVHF